MLIAGITGSRGKSETISLISSMLEPLGNKTIAVDSGSLAALNEKWLKGYFKELESNKVDIVLIKLSFCDIENLISKKVRFDVLVFTDKLENMHGLDKDKYSEIVFRSHLLLSPKGFAVVNMDDTELVSLLQGIKQHILTYGFNPKASITTSSIGDTIFKENFICCLQRTIFAINGKVFEPQEYKLKINSDGEQAYNILAAASFALINGIDLSAINS
jgi:UDP-N-acetylmuramyl tripeptide synthase